MHKWFTLAAVVINALAFTGCASDAAIAVNARDKNNVDIAFAADTDWDVEQVCDALRYHMVEIDGLGRYRPTVTNLQCAASAGSAADAAGGLAQPNEVEDHLGQLRRRYFSTPPGTDMLVFMHGGLVSRSEGLRSAMLLNKAMQDDPELPGHPVFISWHTGGIESYREQTFAIRKGERNLVAAAATAPIAIAADIGRGLADTLSLGALEGDRLVNTFRGEFSACTPGNDTGVRVICPQAGAGDDGDAAETAWYVGATPLRMATAPFVNGLGRTAWENMVRRTRNPFWAERFRPDDPRPGVIKALFSELCRDIAAHPDRKLTLIGHSMGTMIINDLVQSLPECHYERIVFMGAAVSIREFTHGIAPALAHDDDLEFINLSLHPVREARESSWGGAVPSGSLLEWIDEMFTSPATVFDRTMGKWVNMRDVLKTIPAHIADNMTQRVFGTGNGRPRLHGDFNDVSQCFWRESYWGADWNEHAKRCSEHMQAVGLD